MHIIKIKPQLIRKRSQVVTPKNVSIIIRPSKAQVISASKLQKPRVSAPVAQAIQAAPTPRRIETPRPSKLIVNANPHAVSRQKLIKDRRTKNNNKKVQVKHISRETTPESTARIASLKGSGKGRLLLIVGNGPSITEAELGRLRDNDMIDIMSVNKPDSRLWPTKYWTFFDSSQFRRNEDLWNSYNGIIFNSTGIKRQKQTSMQFKNNGGKGWSRDLMKGIHIGRSSVYASMQIGAWLNHDHIYIVGCDMNPEGINGKLHFYGQNPDVDPTNRKDRFKKEAEHYANAAAILSEEERRKFTFCSSYNHWPFVEQFNKMDHLAAVDHILQHASSLKRSVL